MQYQMRELPQGIKCLCKPADMSSDPRAHCGAGTALSSDPRAHCGAGTAAQVCSPSAPTSRWELEMENFRSLQAT